MNNREAWLAKTLVELADTLVADFDVVDFLVLTAERCAQLLEAAEVGLVVADEQRRLRLMASTSESMRILELFELQSAEGPCLDCYRSGEQVVNQPVVNGDRWPAFGPLARELEYRTVHAFPMKLREEIIGAVNVFDRAERHLPELEISLAQALADTATIGLLQERAVRRTGTLAAQLQTALTSRVTIEQAKGVLAERLGIGTDAAFALIRAYARSHNRRLAGLAEEIVRGELDPSELPERHRPVPAPTRGAKRPPS